MVEVRGFEPRSLDNQIKATTCLVYLLNLILKTPLDRISSGRSLKNLILYFKAKIQDQPVSSQLNPQARLSEA